MIWIATGHGWMTEVDDRRRMTGDGSQEMDHGGRMTINLLPFYEDIAVMRSYTILEITTLISNYEFLWNGDMHVYDVLPAVWSHRVRYRALFRDAELNSYMPELQCRVRSRIRSRLSLGDPELHSYNTDTEQAVRDLSLAEQRSLKRGITVPDSQQPLPRTITVPEVQERSTVKRIHQKRKLAAKSTRKGVMANAPTDESGSRRHKLQTRMRSRLSLGDRNSVSTIPRYKAATGNRLQNQA